MDKLTALPLNVLIGYIWKNWPNGCTRVRQNLDGSLHLEYRRRSVNTSKKYPLACDYDNEITRSDWENGLQIRPYGTNVTDCKKVVNAPEREREELSLAYLQYCDKMDATWSEQTDTYNNLTKEELINELCSRDRVINNLMVIADSGIYVPTQQNAITKKDTTLVASKRDRAYETLEELIGTEFRLYAAAEQLPWDFWICQNPDGYIECYFHEKFSLPADWLTIKELWHPDLPFAFSVAKKPEDIYFKKKRRPRAYPIADDAIRDCKSAKWVHSSKCIELYKQYHKDNNEDAPEPLFRSVAEIRKYQKSLTSKP